jgi:hypothetical protein
MNVAAVEHKNKPTNKTIAVSDRLQVLSTMMLVLSVTLGIA